MTAIAVTGSVMDVISLVSIVAALFIVISLSEPLADRTRLPYTVVLAIIGTLIGLGAVLLVEHGREALGLPLAVEMFEINIRASVFLYVLLPTLLFQVSLGLNLRRMADDWVPILVMAVLAVVVATFAIGYALTPFTWLPLMACLMLGAIVATTDPSAVVSIFRNIAAPQRLTRLVEGESLLRLVGLDWSVPDFSTLSRRQKTLAVNIPYRGSKGPLHLLIDSTGIKVEGEGEWHARKHGGPKRRVWRKIHLGIDEETLEIRAVEVTASHIGDAPVLPDLLSQIPAHQQIGSVTADGAYDTRKCHDAIADRGAHAVIPPRKNAKPWKTVTAGAVARNEALRTSKYLGRAIWRRWSGYHRRSRVETKMHCVKLLGQRLMARDFDRQVAELQVRIAVLNGYTALGIPVTEAVG